MANEFNTDTKREAGQPKADTGRYMRCMPTAASAQRP